MYWNSNGEKERADVCAESESGGRVSVSLVSRKTKPDEGWQSEWVRVRPRPGANAPRGWSIRPAGGQSYFISLVGHAKTSQSGMGHHRQSDVPVAGTSTDLFEHRSLGTARPIPAPLLLRQIEASVEKDMPGLAGVTRRRGHLVKEVLRPTRRGISHDLSRLPLILVFHIGQQPSQVLFRLLARLVACKEISKARMIRMGEGPALYGQVCSPLPGSYSEVEGVALLGPDLLDLVSDTQFHRPVQAVNLGADPQTAILEGDFDQQPSESHG